MENITTINSLIFTKLTNNKNNQKMIKRRVVILFLRKNCRIKIEIIPIFL